MATISSNIELIDSFSPVLYNIIDAIDANLAAMENMQQVMGSPVDTAFSEANAELGDLRDQLSQMLSEQSESYVSLSRSVDSVNQGIRENTEMQNGFNESIEQGTDKANKLFSAIGGAVAAYASMAAVKSTIGLSDEIVSTKARIDQMNDSQQTTDELMQMIYHSAQDARGSLQDAAEVVARLGNNAKDAFGSSAEVVEFANLVQKQMVNAGASGQDASNAILQLSQALGSGVLRGDELNSIFEQAPNLIQNIADYLNVPIGKIREMAQEGELSADIVKNAIFSASNDINSRFDTMPKTWSQIFTMMKNDAIMAFGPVLQRINDIANSQAMQNFVDNAVIAFYMLADVMLWIFDTAENIGTTIADNWSWISPIVYAVVAALSVYYSWLLLIKVAELAGAAAHGIMIAAKMAMAIATMAATGATWAQAMAQQGLNAALYACPIVWIVILVIAIVAAFYAAVAAVNKFAGTSISATGLITGALAVAAAFIGNLFVALINFSIDTFAVLWNFIASFANFLGNVLNDPVGAIARLFFDLADVVLSILESLASAIDTVFGSNLSGAVSGWRDGLGGWVDRTYGQGEEIMAKMDPSSMHVGRFEYDEAWDKGYNFGQGLEEKVAEFDPASLFKTEVPGADQFGFSGSGMGAEMADIANNTGSTAGNTAGLKDALDDSSEDLKYLRDIAEQEAINRFTTAEVTINQTNTNHISKGMDLDGVISGLTDAMTEAYEIAAEGV